MARAEKGLLYLDVFLLIFTALVVFLVFYFISYNYSYETDRILEYSIITDNALASNNDLGIGFANYSGSEKQIIVNNVNKLKLIDPIKYIRIENDSNSFEIGNMDECKNKILIERFGYYDDDISKFIFGFCN